MFSVSRDKVAVVSVLQVETEYVESDVGHEVRIWLVAFSRCCSMCETRTSRASWTNLNQQVMSLYG
jgi:hypothetical protein